MIPVHQYFGNRHSAKIRGPRVMRIVEQSAGIASRTRSLRAFAEIAWASRSRKRLLSRRGLIANRAGDEPGHRVHDYRCPQLAAAEHVVADGNFPVRHAFADA